MLKPFSTSKLAALATGLFALLVRLPFVAHRLWDHDSVQFALGVERYDLLAHHPHPPGYPIYIALLKLLAACGVSPLTAMVSFAVLGGAVGATAMVLLVERLVRERGGESGLAAGLFAGALFASNPLLWFYGELPLLYAVEGGVTVVLALAAVRMVDGPRAVALAAFLFALAGGLRPSTLVLLAPLGAWGLWRAVRAKSIGGRGIALALGVGAATIAAWLLPLLHFAGGLEAYRRISREHFDALLPQTSILHGAGWPALQHNLTVLIKWGLQGVLPGLAALVLWQLFTRFRWGAALRSLASQLPLLVVWAVPPIAFFALYHVTKAGYTLIHLPALLVALALLAAPGFEVSKGSRRLRLGVGIALALAMGSAIYLFGRARRDDEPRALAILHHEFHPHEIRNFEDELDKTLAVIRRYPPGTTVLVTVEMSGLGAAGADGFLYSWHRHLQWYLPEYLVVFAVPEADQAYVARGHEPFRLVLSQVALPWRTNRLVYVFSAWPGERLALGPGVASGGEWFTLLARPFAREARIGPLALTAERPPRQVPPVSERSKEANAAAR